MYVHLLTFMLAAISSEWAIKWTKSKLELMAIYIVHRFLLGLTWVIHLQMSLMQV